jgi:hypothetical protein
MAKTGSALKNWFLCLLIVVSVRLALIYVDGGRADLYMKSHLFLTCFCPLLLIFLVLFIRAYYLEYKR